MLTSKSGAWTIWVEQEDMLTVELSFFPSGVMPHIQASVAPRETKELAPSTLVGLSGQNLDYEDDRSNLVYRELAQGHFEAALGDSDARLVGFIMNHDAAEAYAKWFGEIAGRLYASAKRAPLTQASVEEDFLSCVTEWRRSMARFADGSTLA